MHRTHRQLRSGLVRASIYATSLALLGCVPEAEDAELFDDEVRGLCEGVLLPPLPDPITRSDFNWTYSESYAVLAPEENTSPGTVYLPAATPSSPAPGPFPLVIILHANGYATSEYEDIQIHLARNGFASVAIDYDILPSTDPNDVAGEVLAHLQYLMGPWVYSNRLTNNIAVVGHSYGGRMLVRTVELLAGSGVDTNAMVALAPAVTDYDELSMSSTYPADNLLVMFGAADEDPFANGELVPLATAPYAGAETTGFFAYDYTGYRQNELTSIAGPLPFRKTMFYLRAATHGAYVGDGFNGAAWADMTEGYLNAYFRWQLLGQTDNARFFIGNSKPASLDPGLEWAKLYSAPSRVVVDNFQSSSGPAFNTMNGYNLFHDVTYFEGSAHVLNPASAHTTRVLDVAWDGVGDEDIYFAILDADGNRDQSGASYLSFRAGIVTSDPLNPANMGRDFRVVLEDEDGATASVDVSVPAPILGPPLDPRDYMQTIMIRTCSFAGVDLEHITGIYFVFDDPGSETGRIQLDSLEFVY